MSYVIEQDSSQLPTIDFLEEIFTFREKPLVVQLLQENLSLISLLLESAAEIAKYFPDEKLILGVFEDIEAITPPFYHLLILIPTKYTPKETLSKLNQLDDWWIDNLNRADGKLSINVEFK